MFEKANVTKSAQHRVIIAAGFIKAYICLSFPPYDTPAHYSMFVEAAD